MTKQLLTKLASAALVLLASAATLSGYAQCTSWNYFLSNNSLENELSTVYKVTLDDVSQQAQLTALQTFDYPTHIAYDGESGLVYVVNRSGGSFVTIDGNVPFSGISPVVTPDMQIRGAVAAAIGPDGLYIGSALANVIYRVDKLTGATEVFAYADVRGGDLVFDDAGNLFVVSKNGNTLTKIVPGGTNEVIGNFISEINGLALTPNNSVLGSAISSPYLLEKNLDGTEGIIYTLYLDGSEFHLYMGDMASGCFQNQASTEDDCYAAGVVSYTPGTTKNGGALPANRANPNKALGMPEMDNTLNFVSLGFGGELILSFGEVALNGPGADIQIFETTFDGSLDCSEYNEYAEVYFSMDGVNYEYAGTTCTHGGELFDISDINPAWEFIQNIKLVDMSDINGASGDAYDVDGVIALNGCDLKSNIIVPGDCYASEVFEYWQGTDINNMPIELIRSNPANALGEPEETDNYNFFSLGYDAGYIVLGFNGNIINGPGADIEILETSFNTTTCEEYPEYADVYLSLDGVDWMYAGTVCKFDNLIDISDVGAYDFVTFVKIVEAGSSTPDGFDVDGVRAIYNCEGGADMAPEPATELAKISSYPNPSTGNATVTFQPVHEIYTTIEVYDMTGKPVQTLFAGVPNAGQTYTLSFEGNNLPDGIYMYRVLNDKENVMSKILIVR